MKDPRTTSPGRRPLIVLAALLLSSLACARSLASGSPSFWSISGKSPAPAGATQPAAVEPAWGLAPKRSPGAPILTPTPDHPHALPPIRSESETYTVQPGDSLGLIASTFGISLEQLIAANKLIDPNLLEVGQVLDVPAPTPKNPGPAFKIIPDSELVNGPYSALFDVEEFVNKQAGYLSTYKEELNGVSWSGAEIVKRIAQDYSVNPRLLLAVLEYQSGWLTEKAPKKSTRDYPIGWEDPQRKGLYRQLNWAANNLNRGYYLWRVGGTATWLLSDGEVVPIEPTINAGTAGVQQMFALLFDRSNWERAVSQEGLYAVFERLFGYPFDYALEPLVPASLFQPTLQLPFEPGVEWSFTGGPHGGWGDGSAWAALDFGPPGEAMGCVPNEAWVVAVTDGVILRAGDGAVIQDLDGDGLEQTGWTILYMHIATEGRVEAGTHLKAGDRIGHPSCEGGVSSGTHLHLARRYNGEWIAADQDIPFILDGWVSSGLGKEYDGYLNRGSKKVEAYAGNSDINLIQR
ncbi:MAG: LysM peptidoglycan-binding domain-containing protein [Anaerolineales bacterium]|nr:LysM peptidoglycan-binding domain-containing protein [Anaerolineales bacterium]